MTTTKWLWDYVGSIRSHYEDILILIMRKLNIMPEVKLAADARNEKKSRILKSPKPDKVLNVGDRVQIKGLDATRELIQITRRHKTGERFNCYGTVTNVDIKNLVFVGMYDYNGYNERFHINDLEKITENIGYSEMVNKTHKNISDIAEKFYEEYFHNSLNRFSEPTVPLLDANFLSDEKRTSFVNFFLSSGCDCGNERFIEYKSWESNKALRALTDEVDNGDYIAYLPVDLVNLAGYSEKDVVAWIDFLNTLEFEVPLEFKGIAQFKFHRIDNRASKEQIMAAYIAGYSEIEILGRTDVYPHNAYYKVILHGSECGLINEYVFRLLSTLYDNYNKHIPGLTLQLKHSVDDLSNWESVLAATIPMTGGISITRLLNVSNVLDKLISIEDVLPEPYIDSPDKIQAKPKFGEDVQIVDVFASENTIPYVSRRVVKSLKAFANSMNPLKIKYSTYENLLNLLKNKDFKQYIFELKMINNEKNS